MAQAQNKQSIRTCCVCGEQGTKLQLVRFVRTSSGQVELDASGRKPGRGAYLCASQACFAKARKTNKLSRALKTQLSDEGYGILQAQFDVLVEQKFVAEGDDK